MFPKGIQKIKNIIKSMVNWSNLSENRVSDLEDSPDLADQFNGRYPKNNKRTWKMDLTAAGWNKEDESKINGN